MTRRDPLHLDLDAAGMKRRTVRGAGVTVAAQLVKFCLQMGTQIVLARMLDPAQFGLVAMVAPVLGLVLALSDSGLGQAIVQRTDLTHRQVSSMFWINVGIGAGLTALVFAISPLVALFYDEPRTAGIALASAGLILLSSLSIVPMAMLNRQMRFTALSAVEITSLASGLTSGIVAAWLGAGYWALVLMQCVNLLVQLVLAWALCGWRPDRPAIEPGVGGLMKFGFNVMGSNLSTHVSMSADQVIVGAVNGHVALGLYDRSYNLVVKPLMQVMAPASRVAVPLLSRLQDTPDRYARAYLLMLQVANVAAVPGLLAAVIGAEPLVALLLGPKWAAMVPIFFWIGLGGLASALSASTFWLFLTQGRAAEQMRVSVVSAVISVCAFAVGSLWGVVGVARVSALVYLCLQTPLLVWAATRQGPVTLTMVQRGLLPVLAAGLVAAAAAEGVTRGFEGPIWTHVVAVFAASYGVFLVALVLQPAGRALIGNLRSMLNPSRAVSG